MIASPARSIDTTHESHYAFDHGFPTADTMSQSYNDADLNRAIQAYKFFYPTVSGAAIVHGNEAIGVIPNRSDRSAGPAAKEIARPATHPGTAKRSACPMTSAIRSRRVAPSALRMPISRVRSVTTKRRTP